MLAGKLNRKIIIQRATVTKDALNNDVPGWENVLPGDGKVWASKRDASARERLSASEMGADITTIFKVRYSSDIALTNPRDRILLDERAYEIVGVTEIGYRDGLQITAMARAEGGLPRVFS